MAEVKNLFLLTQVHEKQGVKLSQEDGEVVLKFSSRANELMRKLAGRLEFDSEPAAYARALRDLGEGK